MRADALLRQVRKIRDEVERATRDRLQAGMSLVRYTGVSGILRQAREDAIRDEHGNRVPRRLINLDDPRPASGVAAMLWDAKKHHAERQAAGELASTEAEDR